MPKNLPQHEVFKHTNKTYSRWINGWISAEANTDINVDWVFYSDIASNLKNVLVSMMDKSPASWLVSQIFSYKLSQDKNLISHNRGKADDDEWRQNADKTTKHELWSDIPQTVRKLLQLKE